MFENSVILIAKGIDITLALAIDSYTICATAIKHC